MAETTIQWADYTFNPWVGCQRVSPGCEHCYAEAYDKRVGGVPKHLREREDKPQLRWGPKAARARTSVALWKQPLKWNLGAKFEQEAASVENGPPAPRRRVFCASLADVFDMHESIDARWRLELFSFSESAAWPEGPEPDDIDVEHQFQGEPVRVRLSDRAGGDPAEWPVDLRVREFPEVHRG